MYNKTDKKTKLENFRIEHFPDRRNSRAEDWLKQLVFFNDYILKFLLENDAEKKSNKILPSYDVKGLNSKTYFKKMIERGAEREDFIFEFVEEHYDIVGIHLYDDLVFPIILVYFENAALLIKGNFNKWTIFVKSGIPLDLYNDQLFDSTYRCEKTLDIPDEYFTSDSYLDNKSFFVTQTLYNDSFFSIVKFLQEIRRNLAKEEKKLIKNRYVLLTDKRIIDLEKSVLKTSLTSITKSASNVYSLFELGDVIESKSGNVFKIISIENDDNDFVFYDKNKNGIFEKEVLKLYKTNKDGNLVLSYKF